MMQVPAKLFNVIRPSVWQFVWLLLLFGSPAYAQFQSLEDYLKAIDSLENANQMQEVTLSYLQASDWALKHEISEQDPVYLDFS